MPDVQIQNAGGAWTAGASWGNVYPPAEQDVIELVNNSGAVRTVGDLVVIDVTGNNANTTATANDRSVIGVVAPRGAGNLQSSTETYAAGAVMQVVRQGPARINIGANTVVALDPLTSSATAGVAQTNALAVAATVAGTNALVGSFIATALEASGAKDAQNTIRAYIQKM